MAISTFPSIRRLSADDVLRMADSGILGEDERVELLEGVLVEMSPQGPTHSERTASLADRLRSTYEGRACIREEKPLAAGTYSLPEPDIAVVRGRHEDYASRHPAGPDTVLVIELAVTSQKVDREKATVYASAGVREYWMLDLASRMLEVWRGPRDGAYTSHQELAEQEDVALPELVATIRVRDLLP